VTYITGDVSNICGAVSPVTRNTKRSGEDSPVWDIKDDPSEKDCIRGDVSKLRGNVSKNFGEVGDLEGEITKLVGDISRISGKSKYHLRGVIKPSLKGDISELEGDISVYDKVPKKKLKK